MKKLLTGIATFLSICLFINPLFSKVTYYSDLSCEEFAAGNLLEWSTLQEQDSKKFIIEKSEDGINFRETGIVNAAGNSLKKTSYSFLDVEPETKKTFYRLKEIDSYGAISLSPTVLINKSLSNQFSITRINSTEVTENFAVEFKALVAGKMIIEVLDETSTITLFKDKLTLAKGQSGFSVDMKIFPEGIYRVAMTMGMEREILIVNKVKPGIIPLQSSLKSKRKKNPNKEVKN